MKYKLLALDLDDTLLNEQYKISDRNIKALKEAASKGIEITIATGRMFRSALPYARELGITMPLITYHGALIKETTGEKRVLRQWGVPYELALEILRFAETEGFHINIYLDDNLYVKEENENSRYYQSIASIPLETVGDLAGYLERVGKEPTKLTVINREGRLPELQKFLQGKYSSELSVVQSRPFFLEITHREATKGRALKFLAERKNLSPSQVIAMGDSYNDIDMLQYAGMGVAMGNAPPDVQKAADFVAAASSEDGVALFLEKYIL
ncbi:MAG: HAD family phosphatase [Firmicutes bacterium]|nr:HAD family phosphatase [Bacillota bacterium]